MSQNYYNHEGKQTNKSHEYFMYIYGLHRSEFKTHRNTIIMYTSATISFRLKNYPSGEARAYTELTLAAIIL